MAAKTATAIIPIVFEVAIDPIEAGLVASLNHPGGNLTGVVNLNVEVAPKWLEVLRELMPNATSVAVLSNPTSGVLVPQVFDGLPAAGPTPRLPLHILHVS